MPVGIQVQSVSLTFTGGLISQANVQYTLVGTAAGGQGNYVWVLSSTEQNATSATNFVTAFVTKLAGILGLTVTTT